MQLPWGRHFLLCRPEQFGVLYEINPWMHKEVTADPDVAWDQFHLLESNLKAAGATIAYQEPAAGLPDLVFTANAGIINGSQFIPSNFKHPERQGEKEKDVLWAKANGFSVDELDPSVNFEGAGDTLPFFPEGSQPVLIGGYRFRSDVVSHRSLSDLTGVPVKSVELTDERLYHLDLNFCPIDEKRALVAECGIDRYGLKVISSIVEEVFLLEEEEAISFCANSVVVGETIIMPACPPRVGRAIESWGLAVVVSPVSEFQKAGGGCRCLTLALDVDLHSVVS